ncbi:MAG: flavodoxin-dependent (E)-4-hydroxy-3-methylbut-2-enyl-diphosphate synthase, partial [Alphaproteobacteria bacterium]
EIPLDIEFAREAAAAGAACLAVRMTNPTASQELVPLIAQARAHGLILEIMAGVRVLETVGDKERWPDSLANAALDWAQICTDHDFSDFVLSLESPDVMLAAAAYRRLAAAVECPLYLSLGSKNRARGDIVGASMTLGTLLRAGIGDTIRVALPSEPLEEAKAGVDILKALGLSHRGVTIISCPGCARQRFDVSEAVVQLERQLEDITTGLTVSVMGCVVNGPGEAKQADIALVGSGKGAHTIYVAGRPDRRIDGSGMIDQFARLVEEKAEKIDASRLLQQTGQLRVAAQARGRTGRTGAEVAELAVALNHVFPSANAHIVWDNEAQAQTYAQLTRRRTPKGNHSFASSISEMLGVAVAAERSEGPAKAHNIVVIRKELLSAGLTYEAMNNAGNLKARLIIVLVDVVDADAKPAGAMTAYLSRLTSSRPYLSLRDISQRILQHFPQQLTTAARRAEEYARCIATGGTLFEELGLYYVGLVDGNNLDHMLPVLRNLREAQFNSPVLLHVVVNADVPQALPEKRSAGAESREWLEPVAPAPIEANRLAQGLFAAAANNTRVAIVATAGLQPLLAPVIACFEERCYLVDRADQHAVHFAAGLCRGGLRPIVVLDTVNHLRALAGIAHDLVTDRLPVRFVVDQSMAGASGLDLTAVPGFAVATPADDADFLRMMASDDIADRPLLIFTGGLGPDLGQPAAGTFACRTLRDGEGVAILAFGGAVGPVLAASEALAQLHIQPTVVDGRLARPLDYDRITQLFAAHDVVIIAEPDALRGMAAEILLHLTQNDQLELGLKLRQVVLPVGGLEETGDAGAVSQVVAAVLSAIDLDRED